MKMKSIIAMILVSILIFQSDINVYAKDMNGPMSCEERLKRLEPAEPRIMYDTDLLMDRNLENFKEEILPVSSVIKNGQNIPYEIVYKDLNWKRPAYHPNWHSTYWRWSYVPYNIANQQHQVFAYMGGLSWWFDLSNDLALPEGTGGPSPINKMAFTIKYPYVVRLIIFKFNVQSIKYYKNQFVILGKPLRAGITVLDFDTKDLPEGHKLLQLSTPDGYEIDYMILY